MLWRGASGHWDGSYFTGMEGSLRTPAMVRYPPRVPAGQVSNEIVHITDMFTTLIRWAGLEVPENRVIDGVDQRNFFEARQTCSNRVGFPYWLGDVIYGVKWRNFKLVNVLQRQLSGPGLNLPTPNIINLDRDPKERRPFDLPVLHTWVTRHAASIGASVEESVKCQPFIPPNSPLDFVPPLNSDSPDCWRDFSPKDLPPKTDRECAAQ